MKRFFATIILSTLLLAPGLTRAVSLARFVAEPADEQAEPAPQPPAENQGRFGRMMDRSSNEPVESKTGWFIGPLVWKVSLDLSALDPMTVDRGVPALDDRPYILGVMGGIIRNNWRFGGLYVTGAQSDWNKVAGEWRGARITFDALGIFVDYDREYKTAHAKKYYSRIPYLRYGWLLGGIFAYGQLGIEAEGPDLGSSNKWSTTEGIMIVNPYVGLWVSPFDWVWAQVELGYILILMNDQQLDSNGTLLVDGPIGGGPHIGFKLVFGSNPNFKVKVADPR